MISMACQNAVQNHQDACTHFLEASAKSSQVYQTDDQIEKYYTTKATSFAVTTFGAGATDAIGGVGYTYKSYKNHAVDFKLPTLGLADTASNHITTNSYSLNLSWKFPWSK
jgi:hypothetical protein